MTVADLLAVLYAFDAPLAAVFGVAVAVFLVDRVLSWFALVFLSPPNGR